MSKKSKKLPFVSAVIVNFNGQDYLRQCLDTILNTTYSNFEVVIVDNASTDQSLAEIESFVSDSRIKVVKNQQNVGHAKGCNVGAKVAKGDYLVFLDSDIEFEQKSWLSELVNVMENDPTVGIAQAKIVLAQNKQKLEYVCLNLDALGSWSATYGFDQSMFKTDFELMAASSGCCIIRKQVFDQIGGFDDDYFIYDDDTDLSFRVRLLGYRVMFVSSSVVVHRGGVLRGVSGMMLFHSSKNRFYTLLKNYELKNVWWRFPLLTFFTLMVSATFFVTKQHQEAKASLKGVINPVAELPKIWKKRLTVQRNRRVTDSELVEAGFVRNDFQGTLDDLKLKLKHMQ
ncbi:MAG: glycosyltransferase family 2 protein [Candidatus Bathyarchaeota archaeon]|nr:glycosyltransferase family 2 protein [Candidatus Bathyarchaeota archaeon]